MHRMWFTLGVLWLAVAQGCWRLLETGVIAFEATGCVVLAVLIAVALVVICP